MRRVIALVLTGPFWLAMIACGPALAATTPANPLSMSPAAASRPAGQATPVAASDDRTVISQALDAAQAERQKMLSDGLPAPPAALAEEILERNRLIEQLADTLARHLDAIDRMPDTLRLGQQRKAELEAWTEFSAPPPYSILKIDQLREAFDAARLEVENAKSRRVWEVAEQSEAERLYKAAGAFERQCDERAAQQPAGSGRDRQIWLRDLAKLRGRIAAEDVAEAEAQIALTNALEVVKAAEADLLSKQLAKARQSIRFSQDDLDSMLSSIDRRRHVLESRSKTLIEAGPNVRRALEDAEQALATAQAQPARADETSSNRTERLSGLAQALVWRRLLSDNHALALDMTRRMLELCVMERTGWQYRWLLLNAGDFSKQREAAEHLQHQIDRLNEWADFINAQIATAAGRIGDEALSQRDIVGEAQTTAGRILAAKREQADLYRTAQQAVETLRRIFTVWHEEFLASQSEQESLRGRGGLWCSGLRKTAVAFWNFELFSAEDTLDIDGRKVVSTRSVTIGKSLGVILLLVAGYFLSNLTLRGIRHLLVHYLGMKTGHTQTVLRWAHFVWLSMLFIIALYLVNIPLTVFAFLGGALAIGVGFGTQVLLKNLISGIMLLVERPLRVGDLVEVGSVVGTVTNISIRSSTVRTSDGIEILVPNSTFIENNVTNWTYSNAKVRRSVSVGVEYGAKPDRVSELLLSVAADHADVVADPAPRVLLDDFAADALVFKLQYWIDYAKGADGSLIASDLRTGIERVLSEAGIDIPLPQRVVHITRQAKSPT